MARPRHLSRMQITRIVRRFYQSSDKAASPVADFPRAVIVEFSSVFSRVSRQLPVLRFRNRHASSNRPARLVFPRAQSDRSQRSLSRVDGETRRV